MSDVTTRSTDGGFRPGVRPAGRPLHVIFVLDASGSMASAGKMDALNGAIEGALPHLRDLADQNPFVEVLVRAVVFADGARWHVGRPTPVHELHWAPIVPGGFTDFGAALRVVADVLRVPPMEARAFPPVVVVVSDGRPTDDHRSGIDRLLAEPWGRRAVRLAIAIGSDADLGVLEEFIADPAIAPFRARDAEQLAYLVRFATLAASRLASTPADGGAVPAPPPLPEPEPAPEGLMVW